MEQRIAGKIDEMKSSPTPPDPLFLQLLKKEFAAVQANLANIEQALKDREAVLSETIQALESEKLKNVAPADQLEAAKKKLNQGDTSEAEAVFAQVLERTDQHIERTKQFVEAGAEAAFRLAKLAYDRVDYRAAQKYYEKAAQLSPDNPVYLNEVAIVAHNLAQYDKAIEYFEKALVITLKTFGADHPEVADCWSNLGLALSSKGDYDKTLEYLEKALASDLKTFGPEHRKVAIRWHNLGEALRAKGQYDKAIEYYEKALASNLKTFGPGRPEVSLYWNNLGLALSSKGDYDKAIEYYEKSLASNLKTLGPKHPVVAINWWNLGDTWGKKVITIRPWPTTQKP